jgi:hypothetical protein
MRTLKLMILGTLVACTASATDAESPGATSLAWLSGHWCAEIGGESIEESWLSPRGSLMLGVGQTVKGGKTVTYEFMRIESGAGGTHYIAQHRAGTPTAFRMTASGANWARFENPTHDFPKRVEYRRTPKGLQAEIAGPGKDGKERVIPFEYRNCN